MREVFEYNNKYLMKNGRPWFPVMGEMHYSRYQEALWEESLRKMKAGGVSVVSTYVIWIHHEEEEGCFDFSGCRNLGKFLQLCGKVGLYVFLRPGPWVHGEVRNGGFPDWLQKKEKEILLRSDDPEYLSYVRRFWQQVYAQAEGMLHDQGGPVIGMQIENEYGHVGGQTGEPGEQHMRTLTALARELGFQVPLYTATGWGGACTGGLLPVMGGYCEAPWEQSTKELKANTNYVFSKIRNDSLIACDHQVEDAVTFNEADFPYLTAELGGGLQVTKHRRPVATGADIGAMSLTKLGSGVALLGYYMYHGGSNPLGKHSTLQESKATGYLNDLPEINYDFNAPIRQYGAISDSYREIRLLASFLQDFGEDLAGLEASIQPENVNPEDMHTLRLSCRHDQDHGYLFFNNYQRRRTMEDHKGVILKGSCKAADVLFPETDILSGEYGFFPYRMKLGNALLVSALATPLCRLQTEKETVTVFYGDRFPRFSWEGTERARILHISRNEALHAQKLCLEQDYLILSENYVWEEEGKLIVTGERETVIKAFPALTRVPENFSCIGQEKEFFIYKREINMTPSKAAFSPVDTKENETEYEISITYGIQEPDRASGTDVILLLDYAGESMDIYLNGKKINNYFYTGQKARLSLGYFGFPEKLTAVVHALRKEDEIFLEQWPEMKDNRACSIRNIDVLEEFR